MIEQALSALRWSQAANISYLRSAGDQNPAKETLVLLHGISGGAASWYYQIDALADQFKLIAWDAPGYGESQALSSKQPEVSEYAKALADSCHALSLPTFHLVGQSMGGLIAAAYSHTYPQQIKSLTLLNPAPGYADEEESARQQRMDQRINQMMQLGPEGLAEQRAPMQLSDKASTDALALVRWNSRRLHPAGYIQAVHMLMNSTISDYANYPGPVQVLSGDADIIVAQSIAKRIAQYYPRAQFHSLAGLGHAAYAEGPDQVVRYLREFIAG